MAHPSDILIVGGGVIGLSTAYFLAKEGARVTVMDQAAFGQEASWAGAGILPEDDPEADHPLSKLRGRSAALFPSLSDELGDLTGIDNGYVRCGGLEFVDRNSSARHCLDETQVRLLEPALAPGV